MNNSFGYDIFLSYSSKNKQIVYSLAERLREDGIKIWLDVWEIQPGDPVSLKIQSGLENSKTLIICMSSDYFDSVWGALEHHSLLYRDPTNAQRRFIPLFIEDCALPDIIAQFACIDWRTKSDEAYNKILSVCKKSEKITVKQTDQEERAESKSQILKGHTNYVRDVSVSPDGNTLVSCSHDCTLRIWNIKSGECLNIIKGHKSYIWCAFFTPDGEKIVSCSSDKMLKVWDLATGKCIETFRGHTDSVYWVAITPDGKKVVSGSKDTTLKVWDLDSGQCLATLEGHTDYVYGVAITPDGKKVVSGSKDTTLKVWDLNSGQCLATLEGHTETIYCVAITLDGKTIVSGSKDKTIKLWDVEYCHCRATFEGHNKYIRALAITPDGKMVISGSPDRMLKVWEIETGRCCTTLLYEFNVNIYGICVTPDNKNVISGSRDGAVRIWSLAELPATFESSDTARYTNAKVVLVGESGVGKTGLALRLAENRWEETGSTHGMNVWQLKMPDLESSNMDREVWLWDFAGQPDYRLIHQLYMDETALALMVIDPQRDNPFEPLDHWEKALQASVKHIQGRVLIAGRCDRGGLTISQKKVEQYQKEHGYSFFINTSAKIGDGCKELKKIIAEQIPWELLPWTATTLLFKSLKDAIVSIKEEGVTIIRVSELRQRLQLMLQVESLEEDELRAVIGLVVAQGIIQQLDFGDFVLLQPAQINNYASAVVRSVRENSDEIGCIPEHAILQPEIDFKDMARLCETDECILLRSMLQTFLDRSLCARVETDKGSQLVFPSYFKQDRPDFPEQPKVVVTYSFSGTLDEIYTTLVVRLHYTNNFEMDQLWRYAVDFKTITGKQVGLQMKKKTDGSAEIHVYFEPETSVDMQVSFIKYIHEHLKKRAQNISRVRSYICPHCGESVENRRAVKIRLQKGCSDIICSVCEERVPLLDLIETKFASDELLREVQKMDINAQINLDNESLELILVGHAFSTAGEAGQIFRPTPNSDWGIDGEIEFKNDKSEASGRRVYLQLKSGDSYLRKRKDGKEVFRIKNMRHAEYWQAHEYPVMLVIRNSDGQIRWMNITEYLKHHDTTIKQIIFEGEPFSALNVARLRDRVLS